MPPLQSTEIPLRKITAGAEPNTYEAKREILQASCYLKMHFLDGELEIEGKIPVPVSGQKKCDTRVRSDAEGNPDDSHGCERRRFPQHAGRIPKSWTAFSSDTQAQTSRTSSSTSAAFPNARRAAQRASSGESPLCCCSSASNSKSQRGSRSMSCS